MIFNDCLNWVSFAWFLTLWIGYTFYALHESRKTDCLASLLSEYRVDWVKGVLRRENRVADMMLISGMMQLSSFLASTTIFVVAGLLTALSSSDTVLKLLSGHSFVSATTKEQVQFKMLALVLIFIFAFFRLTWSMRQYIFCTTLLGTAPLVSRGKLSSEAEEFAKFTAKICDRAAREFNYGLRAYYFALALISWFISPWLFMLSCTLVVWILYRREFRSLTLKYLVQGRKNFVRIGA
jgi:uncharacterized membrane protein